MRILFFIINVLKTSIWTITTLFLALSIIAILYKYTEILSLLYFLAMLFFIPYSVFYSMYNYEIFNKTGIAKYLAIILKIMIFYQIFEIFLKYFEYITYKLKITKFKFCSILLHIFCFNYYLYTRFVLLNYTFEYFWYYDVLLIISCIAVFFRLFTSITLILMNSCYRIFIEGGSSNGSYNTTIHASTLSRVHNSVNHFHNLTPKSNIWKGCGLVFMGCTLAVGCYTAYQIRLQNQLATQSIMLQEVAQGLRSKEDYSDKYLKKN